MKENKKVKIIGTIVGIVLFIVLIAGFTYAWFTWESSKISVGGNTACFDINYTEGNLVTDDMLLVDANRLISNNKITIKRGMAVTNITAAKDSKCTKLKAKLSVQLAFNTIPSIYGTSGSCANALNYAVASYDASRITTVNARALENMTFDIVASGTITAAGTKSVYEKALADDGTSQDYLIIFYIDGNKANNDIDSKNIKITANVSAIQTS